MTNGRWVHYSMTGKLPREKRQLFNAIQKVLPYLYEKRSFETNEGVFCGSWQYGVPNRLSLFMTDTPGVIDAVGITLREIFPNARFSEIPQQEPNELSTATQGVHHSARDVYCKFR